MDKHFGKSIFNDLGCIFIASGLWFKRVDGTNNDCNILVKVWKEVETLGCFLCRSDENGFVLLNIELKTPFATASHLTWNSNTHKERKRRSWNYGWNERNGKWMKNNHGNQMQKEIEKTWVKSTLNHVVLPEMRSSYKKDILV